MEWLSRIVDVIKLPTKYALWIAIASGILLFTPSKWLAALRVEQFVNENGKFIGLVFVSSTSLVIVTVLHWLWDTLRIRYERHRYKVGTEKEIIAAINELDIVEKEVLSKFLTSGNNTLLLPIDQPAVAGLLSKGILEITSNIGRVLQVGHVFPLQIVPGIRRRLSMEMVCHTAQTAGTEKQGNTPNA